MDSTAGATEGFADCVTTGFTAVDTDGVRAVFAAGEGDGMATGVVAGLTFGSHDALATGFASTGDDVGAGGSSGNDNIDAIGDELTILPDEIIELSSGA